MASSNDNPKAANALAETYARALFELAEETGSLAEVADEVSQVAGLLESEPSLAALFAHRAIASDRRGASIQKIFSGRLSSTTVRFLMVLNDKGRLDQLLGIQTAFDRLMKLKRGEVDVDVYTAGPLGASQLKAVADRISATICKTAIAHPHTDPSLIGGLKIRIEDKLIDASVASQLRRLKRQIMNRGHDVSHAEGG